MRKGLALIVLVACGGGQQQTNSGNVRIEQPDAAVAARPSGPIEPLGVPRGAPFVATFDTAALAAIAPLRREIESDLGLPDGSLLQQAASLGLDTTRPITIAAGPLDDEESKLVSDLRAEFKDPSKMPNDDTIKRITSVDALVVVRALLPTTDAAKLEQTFGKFLEHEGAQKKGDAWTMGGQRVVFSDDGRTVAVDTIIARGEQAKAYAAFAASAHEPAPPLEGASARAAWDPQAVAGISYLLGVARAAGAVSGDSVDPGRRATILRIGLIEAGSAFTVATFDHIDVEARLSPFEIVARAKPSASFAMPGPEAFAPSAGLSVNLAGQGPFVQASRAFWKAWPFPGGNSKTAIETMRDGGEGAMLAGLPHLLAMVPAIESRRSADAQAFDWTRFDRAGTLLGERTEAEFVSLMPAGTKRADAECAFAPKTPCDRKAKLKLGSVVKIGELRAALYEIGAGKDKRFVVVSSDGNDQKLDPPTLTQAAGMQLDVETRALAGALPAGTLPAKITGQMSSEGGEIVFRVK